MSFRRIPESFRVWRILLIYEELSIRKRAFSETQRVIGDKEEPGSNGPGSCSFFYELSYWQLRSAIKYPRAPLPAPGSPEPSLFELPFTIVIDSAGKEGSIVVDVVVAPPAVIVAVIIVTPPATVVVVVILVIIVVVICHSRG
jgi:hypothetical protein